MIDHDTMVSDHGKRRVMRALRAVGRVIFAAWVAVTVAGLFVVIHHGGLI